MTHLLLFRSWFLLQRQLALWLLFHCDTSTFVFLDEENYHKLPIKTVMMIRHGAYVVVILGFVFQGGFGEEATTMLEQPQPALVSSSEISPSLSHRDQAYKNEKNDMKTIDKPRTLTIMLQQRKRPAAPGAPHVPREVVRQQKRTKHRQTKLDLLNKRSRRGQPEGSGDRERDLSSDAAAIVQLTGHPVITYHALLHMGSDMQDLWVVRSTFCIYTFILSFFCFGI